MFLLRSKSLVLERHLTESWLTPLWTGSWSVKSLQTLRPCWRKLWRLVMLIIYVQRGPKPGLSHWQTKNSDKDHKAIGVLILASFPSSGACSQTDQGLDQLYRWSERFQTRKLLGLLLSLWGQEQSTVRCNRPWTGWVGISLWGCRGWVTAPTIFHVCAREGWRECREGDRGFCDLFPALNDLCGLVCGWDGGFTVSLSYLSANQMVIWTFLPTPPPQLLQLVIDVYKMLWAAEMKSPWEYGQHSITVTSAELIWSGVLGTFPHLEDCLFEHLTYLPVGMWFL